MVGCHRVVAGNRVWRSLPQAAQAGPGNLLAEVLQLFNVPFLPLTSADLLQDLQDTPGAHPAGHTFAAALVLGELHKKASDVHHTGVLVHDDHAA